MPTAKPGPAADPQQLAAIEAIVSGENVFLTGGAGCGKSFVIQKALKRLQARRLNVVVCAPTGIAALNVGGMTVHRAFKLGIGVLGRHSPLRVREPVSEADVVVIDEISMLRCDVFDAVTAILRKIRPRPQLVVVGDFSQLPPVMSATDEALLKDEYGLMWHGPLAFQGRAWDSWDFHPFVLTSCHRQQDDGFLAALTGVRQGNAAACQWLSANANPRPAPGTPYVAATNRVVDQVNARKLAELKGEAHTFRAATTGNFAITLPVETEVVLKEGARVVCCKNDPEGDFVNGSLGTVAGFVGEGRVRVKLDAGRTVTVGPLTWNNIEFEYDEETDRMREVEVGTFAQVPLRLAWAMTIHKTQGLTLDSMMLDPVCFERGQLYVALSRVRSIQGLSLAKPIDPSWLKVDPAVREFHRKIWEESKAWDDSVHENRAAWATEAEDDEGGGGVRGRRRGPQDRGARRVYGRGGRGVYGRGSGSGRGSTGSGSDGGRGSSRSVFKPPARVKPKRRRSDGWTDYPK